MAKRRKIEVGSGDVFTDLGFADAKERRLKVTLAIEVNRVIEQRGLTQDQTARKLGLRQPHVSELTRYRLDRFSVERLMEFLTRLGKDVEIRISQRTAHAPSTQVRVHLSS